MHIKQVVICGFRSYKDQMHVEPFSPGHNVVIGRNGTGKSNFFDAIRFGLLTSRFAALRQDERQALLHEGSGANVMSAYVEIIFDNADGRLPVDTEEVVLRRTIGLKKDEYFLNRRHITKSDVTHLLESAGFSRSNPYYIVQQGKVNALALMKDRDRLELLKEVAGTKVYEDRRIESLKIMHDTQSRRDKILEVISYIEERLGELEEEKNELKEYQKLDKQKRALEYTMHDKELQSIRQELDRIEKNRIEEAARSNQLHNQALETHEEIRQIEKEIRSTTQQIKVLQEQKASIEEERSGLMKTKCELELNVREFQEKVNGSQQEKEKLRNELQLVEKKVLEANRELNEKILPEYKIKESKAKETEALLLECKRKSLVLTDKQSRKSQFKSQAERDAFLKKKLHEVNALLERKKTNIQQLETNIYQVQQDLNKNKMALEKYQQDSHERRETVDKLYQKLHLLKEERNSLVEDKKKKWRRDNEISIELREYQDDLRNGEEMLQRTMPGDVRRGILAVKRMQETTRGIYGPIIELIRPKSSKFYSAIDEAAGNSLFHVVVENDQVATTLMKELSRKNLGRVTFLPLNRLRNLRDIEYPQSDDVMPLIEQLDYSNQVKSAIEMVFGKKLVCRDLATAQLHAEKWNMDCLTLDGDMVQRRGALNGGYKDPQRSRIKAMELVNAAKSKLDSIRSEAEQTRNAVVSVDQKITSVLSEMQKIEVEKNRCLDACNQLQKDHERLVQEVEAHENSLEAKTQLLELAKEELTALHSESNRFSSEIASKMEATLSAAELQELDQLTNEINTLNDRRIKEWKDFESIRSRKNQIDTLLEGNYYRRQLELKKQLDSNIIDDESMNLQELENCTMDYNQAVKQLQNNSEYLSKVDTSLSNFQGTLNKKLLVRLEELKNQDTEHNEELQQETRKAEALLNRRGLLLERREDTMRFIRELGTLPLSELEQYKHLSYKPIVHKLQVCQDALKGYHHVNKKALDQYISFNEQRSTLLERKKELDDGFLSIKELIDVLDQRKDEAILRTFKGVSHHFTQVFNELVPTGSGRMVIVRSSEEQEEKTDSDVGVSTFSGVQIKVNFRGEGDSYLMSQLSGGQKALVALAFIFAIQRCDPAPFYLFDEIDQALDSTHRAAVAAMIQRQAHSEENPAQFITSTFRPEMVNVADKFYGIGHQNKISNVHTMSKEESLDFIANILAEEESIEKKNQK